MTKGTLGAASSGRVDFGAGYTGLATVAYKLFAADGTLLQDWTTTGVTESPAGSGIYHVNWAANFYSTTLAATPQYGGIEWRTASSGGIYATDDLEISYPADASVAAVKAKTDNLPTDPADASDIAALIAAIPAAVWGAGTRTLTGFGTLVADIWAAVVDSVGVTTLLSRLTAARAAKLDLIGSALAALDAPVFTGGSIQLVHGDDYSNSDGRALNWTGTAWPDISAATIKLALHADKSSTTTQFTGTPVSATQARVELTAAQTASLEVDSYSYDLQATLPSGRVVTLARDRAKVLQDYAT